MSTVAAEYRVMRGIAWLNANVPGWFDRAKLSGRLLMMDTGDYDILGIACKGTDFRGKLVCSSGAVCRAAPELDTKLCGIDEDLKAGISYYDLNTVWHRILDNPSPPRGYVPIGTQPPGTLPEDIKVPWDDIRAGFCRELHNLLRNIEIVIFGCSQRAPRI